MAYAAPARGGGYGTMDAYTVVKKIGTGTYGSAYLVSLRSNASIEFVLKKIRLDEVSDKERHAAEQEVELLQTLDHAFILGYVESFVYKNHLCIITEYCEAGDLYTYLKSRKSPLPEAQVLEWFAQIALAIHHCHEHKVLHRDLKTQNIFLTKHGDVKLGDFGIARVLRGPMEMAQTIIGTPYYMSPEIIECKPYDFKSDIWSLGCVLYEMATLKHAFDASDMNGLVMKVLRGKVVPLPDAFSPQLSQMINKLLSKSPRGRPTLEMIFSAEFLQDVYQKSLAKASQMQVAKGRQPAPEPRLMGAGGGGEMRVGLEVELQREIAEREALEGAMAELRAARQPMPAPTARGGDMGVTGGRPRRSAPMSANPRAASRATAYGRSPEKSGPAVALSPSPSMEQEHLNHALHEAEERLRKIQGERDAVREQAMALEGAGGASGSVGEVPYRPTWGGGGAAPPTFGGEGSLSQYIVGDEPTPKGDQLSAAASYWTAYDRTVAGGSTTGSMGTSPGGRSRPPVAGRRAANVEPYSPDPLQAPAQAWGTRRPGQPAAEGADLIRETSSWEPVGNSPFQEEAGREDALEAQLQAHRERRRAGADTLTEDDMARYGSYQPDPRVHAHVEPAHMIHAYSDNAAFELQHQGRHQEEADFRRHAATVATSQPYAPSQLSPGHRRTDHLGPKERMEARKREEARRREEQLLMARKQYFEERRQAEKKNREMYDHAPVLFGSKPKSGRAASGDLDDLKTQHLAVSIRIKDLQERMDTMPIGGGRGRPASADPRARLDLEAEMEQPSPHGTRELLPTQSFVRGQVNERVGALRKLCAGNLGKPLFDQVYIWASQGAARRRVCKRRRVCGGHGEDPGPRPAALPWPH